MPGVLGSEVEGRPLRVVIIDDQRVLRELLAALLATTPRYQVLAQTSSGKEGIELCERFRPDLVILDIMLPDLNGVEVLRRLRERFRATKVLVVTAYEQASVVQRAFEAAAHGIVTKGVPLHELREAIERVASGGVYYCSRASELLREGREQPLASSTLTMREREILQRVASGASSKAIAAELGLSEKTVSNHRANIMRKVGVRETAGLTRYAIAQGLIAAEP